MSTRRLFTASFFRLTPHDQAAVVDAEIHGLELAVGATPEDQAAINRMIERIEQKAIKYGIFGTENTTGHEGREEQ